MSRIVVVSNRVAPVDEGSGSTGGLAVAVLDSLREVGGIWFGWSGEIAATGADGPPKAVINGPIERVTLDLAAEDHAGYYNGYANRTLWPLLHYRLGLTEYNSAFFEAYKRVNRRFARHLVPLIRPGDLIWIHDYHLFLLPTYLRQAGVTNRIGFFVHTPLPVPEVLTAMPDHAALVEGLCHCDLVGFQTADDLRAFVGYIEREAGGNAADLGDIEAFGRKLRAGVFPISIDVDAFVAVAARGVRLSACRSLVDSLVGRALLVGVDRLDYSKGLDHRFLAFQHLLERHGELRHRVSFLQIAPTSRSEVPEYRAMRRELERLAGRINGRFAELDWVPIRYINRSYGRTTLAGIYRIARLAVVTPLRDGMNLVAKEFVAAQDPDNPGVLVLSRFAGAARELDAALIVNPFDIEAVGETMNRGLTMSLEERRERWSTMIGVIRRQDIVAWRRGFLAALAAPAAPQRAAARHASSRRSMRR
jgi:trehalose 6-phosphate synthase